MIHSLFSTKIQILHSSNPEDYFNTTLGKFLKEKDIVHLSGTNTPQQNGIAQRKIDTN